MGRSKQVGQGAVKGGRVVAPSAAVGLEPKRHRTPEERRAAVEAFERSGLTQAAFARQWGVSHVTLGKWLQRHAAGGPKALERLAEGPAKWSPWRWGLTDDLRAVVQPPWHSP